MTFRKMLKGVYEGDAYCSYDTEPHIQSLKISIAFQPKMWLLFLFLHINICCGYSLEASLVACNEYQKNVFSCRNKEKCSTSRLTKEPY